MKMNNMHWLVILVFFGGACSPNWSAIEGRVVDELNPAGLGDLRVIARTTSDIASEQDASIREATVSTDGRFRLEGLLPGKSYHLGVANSPMAQASTVVEAPAAGETRLIGELPVIRGISSRGVFTWSETDGFIELTRNFPKKVLELTIIAALRGRESISRITPYVLVGDEYIAGENSVRVESVVDVIPKTNLGTPLVILRIQTPIDFGIWGVDQYLFEYTSHDRERLRVSAQQTTKQFWDAVGRRNEDSIEALLSENKEGEEMKRAYSDAKNMIDLFRISSVETLRILATSLDSTSSAATVEYSMEDVGGLPLIKSFEMDHKGKIKHTNFSRIPGIRGQVSAASQALHFDNPTSPWLTAETLGQAGDKVRGRIQNGAFEASSNERYYSWWSIPTSNVCKRFTITASLDFRPTSPDFSAGLVFRDLRGGPYNRGHQYRFVITGENEAQLQHHKFAPGGWLPGILFESYSNAIRQGGTNYLWLEIDLLHLTAWINGELVGNVQQPYLFFGDGFGVAIGGTGNAAFDNVTLVTKEQSLEERFSDLMISQDFSKKGGEKPYSGDFEGEGVSWLIQDGKLVSNVKKSDAAYWYYENEPLVTAGKVTVDIELRNHAFEESGLILRYKDDDNFCTFSVTPNILYFQKRVDGVWTTLLDFTLDMPGVSLSETGEAKLTAYLDGTLCHLLVNDQYLASVSTPEITRGSVGLFARGRSSVRSFDNLEVWVEPDTNASE